MIEHIAIAGRTRARKRAAAALVGRAVRRIPGQAELLVIDSLVWMTPLVWLEAMPVAPRANHIRKLLDRMHLARGLGLPAENDGRIHEDWLQKFVREGFASDAH